MEKYIFDERNGLWYELQGDYYLPCLNLLTSGKLNEYLAALDKQADDMFFRLVKQMAEREGVTETLKAENQMEWVGRMNNIRSRAKEFINNELIFS